MPSLAAIARVPDDLVAAAVALCLDAAALPVLLRALDLDLPARLARGPATLDGLAAEEADRATSVALEMVLELGCGFGLFARRDRRYELTVLARTCFLADSPLRLLGLVERHRRYVAAIAALPAALRETKRADRRVWSSEADAGAQADYFRARAAFNEASRDYFRDTASLLARAHCRRDLAAHRVVCDVGAGPAAFAAILKAAAPHLQVHAVEITYEDPAYLATTAEDLRAAGLDVALHALNVLHEPLPPAIDLLTANRLFSGLDRDGADGWAERLYAALAPGGTLALVDFFATGEPAHDRSVAALVALWMAWNRHELQRAPLTDPSDDRHAWGWNPPWRCDELARVLARAGFHDIRARSVVPPFALIEARK
ncbi:class I SAM-dependent methyltransferase [Nannocystis exedens]|uniref:class I SAM-dependent methyltransferase n=1 Tax=Nannocystis exedens TaxID=54 RepID=UPI001160484B|nr:class I SAM-dependent methyltransferase [Nannocystis exedens]